MRGVHFEMNPMPSDVRLVSLPSNATCALTTLFPNSIQMFATPFVMWIGIILTASMFTRSSISRLSIQASWKELTSSRRSRLDVLDVFRVVAIVWVMINHTGSEGRIDILERRPSADAFKRAVHDHPIFGALLGNSALGVEIFLVLSGLLAARSWLRVGDQPFWTHYKSFISRRVFRLMPSIFVFIMLAAGPSVKALLPRYHETMISSCGLSGIASHLTFLGNWQSTPTCLGYLWYLGLDMQLYMAAPFLLHLLHNKTKTALLASVIVTVVSAVIRAGYCTAYGVCNKSDVDIPFISYPDQDPETLAQIYGGLWEMYGRPYTKCGPFVLGLLAGYFTVHYDKLELSAAFSRRLLIGSTIVCISTIYAILPEYWYPEQGDTVYNIVYTAIFRTVFAAGIIGMIASLVYRKESLSISPIWAVLGRLTYNAYLLHMPIIYIFNYLPFLQTAAGAWELMAVVPFVFVLSFIAASLFYVLVEAPMSKISVLWSPKVAC